jgi:peptidyl-prolyl cis-trans isomerase SurA
MILLQDRFTAMKKMKFTLLTFFLLGFFINSAMADVPLDKIAVIVNDSVITQSEINQAKDMAKQQLEHSNTPLPSDRELSNQVINSLIYRNIQRQMVKNAGIKISEAELNAAITKIATGNRMSLAQLKLAVQGSGLNYADYRKNIREQIAFSHLQQQEAGRDINVSNQEITEFLDSYKNVKQPNAEYHLEDIFVPLSDSPSSDEIKRAKEKAEELAKQVKKGANFKQLAAGQSAGQEALKGGDLGWEKLAEMPIIFADQVKTMKIDQISGPLRAPNGFHIIKLTGIRGSLQKLGRDQIRELIFRRKFEEKLQTWLQQMRAGAYIKFVD